MEPKESYVQRAQKWFMEGGRGRKQRIARHARAGEQGWEPLWVPKMDSLVGKVVTIESMDYHGNVYIEESDYYFPYFIFEEAKVANSSREAERKAIYVAGAMRCGLKKGDRATRKIKLIESTNHFLKVRV